MSDGPLFSRENKRDAQRIMIVVVLAILVIIAGGVIATYGNYIAGYATRPVRLADPVRIENMSAQMNQSYQAMLTAEQRVYSDRQAIDDFLELYGDDPTTYPQGKRAELDQLRTNYRNSVSAYNGLCGTYLARLNDEYQDIAIPDDLPGTCVRFS